MHFMDSKIFKKYFVPGIVFQSVVIAGGYGTGKELTEFFAPHGTLGGLLSMGIVSLLTWSVVCAVTFEFTRVFKTYDYKSMTQKLLGPFCWLYELCYFAMLLMVLAVVTAATGEIVHELFGINKWYGIVGMAIAVFTLVVNGSEAIERFLSYWSFVLYAVYILFLLFAFLKFGDAIVGNLQTGTIEGNWALSGFKYAFYNLGIIPAVLYTVRHCETRTEAVGAGLMAGIIGILPAVFLFVALTAFYPKIQVMALPINYMLKVMNTPWLQYLFQIVLFGTLVETGSGFIFAVTDRFERAYQAAKKNPPKLLTPFIAVVLVSLGTAVASFGLTDLISMGYGTLTWAMFAVFVVPMLTLGLYKIATAKGRKR